MLTQQCIMLYVDINFIKIGKKIVPSPMFIPNIIYYLYIGCCASGGILKIRDFFTHKYLCFF